jgi:Trypsin-like peptidase domain
MSPASALKVILLSIVLCGCSQRPLAQHDPYRAVCQIDMQISGICVTQGSGTLIAVSGTEGLVLSCRHVAECKGDKALVRWLGDSGTTTAGRVISVVPGGSYNNDLALLVATVPAGVLPKRIAKFDPDNGPWRCVGYRRGVLYECIAYEASESEGLITFNAAPIGGMSGGCMLDADGCVVGVVVGTNKKLLQGCAANGKYLSDLIESHCN